MANYYTKQKDSVKKIVKKIINRLAILILILIIIISISINIISKDAKKLKKANIDIETTRIKNAISSFKIRTGEYPNLDGNENELDNVKNLDGNYSFDMFYGTKKLYKIPENLEKNVIESNNVIEKRDNKGGWVYNIKTGEIEPNIE